MEKKFRRREQKITKMSFDNIGEQKSLGLRVLLIQRLGHSFPIVFTFSAVCSVYALAM